MRGSSTDRHPPTRSPSAKSQWVAPLCGLAVSAIVLFVWRPLHWPYPREFSLGLLFFVMIGLGSVRDGSLRSRPWRTLAFVAVSTVIGAAIAHIPVE